MENELLSSLNTTCAAVKTSGVSMHGIGQKHGIPMSTLQHHVSGKYEKVGRGMLTSTAEIESLDMHDIKRHGFWSDHSVFGTVTRLAFVL